MLKKISIILILMLLMISMCGNVNAAELKTNLDIIQKASETKYLENDQGFISKTIVDSNSDTGEVTIELKLSNTAKEVEKINDTEVFLVVDNSPSMDYNTSLGKTRKELVLNSASQLVESIFNNFSSVKVGLIDFHGYRNKYDATVRQKLTNDKSLVISAIDKQVTRSTVSGTNIDAGLQIAKENFSNGVSNKIIVLLTDGAPTTDCNGTDGNNDVTSEKSIIAQENTKNKISSLKSEDIYIIAMLTDLDEADENTTKYNTLEELNEAVERTFGTTNNPIPNKFYYVKSADINSIITTNILNDVSTKIQNPINTTKVVDYFPENITDNFDFSYVGSPSIGTTSDTIDTESKTITWDIGTLKGDEVATLKYKLKIKDMKNAELLNKTIATNEKVVLTYKDTESKDYTVELTSSPKIQLSEVKEELTATVSYDPTTNTTGNVVATIKTNKEVNKVDGWTLSDDGKTLTKTYSTNATETVHLVDLDGMTKDVEVKITNITSSTSKQDNEKDNTTAEGTLPQTGVNMTISIAIIIAIILIAVALYKKYNSYKDIK